MLCVCALWSTFDVDIKLQRWRFKNEEEDRQSHGSMTMMWDNGPDRFGCFSTFIRRSPRPTLQLLLQYKLRAGENSSNGERCSFSINVDEPAGAQCGRPSDMSQLTRQRSGLAVSFGQAKIRNFCDAAGAEWRGSRPIWAIDSGVASVVAGLQSLAIAVERRRFGATGALYRLSTPPETAVSRAIGRLFERWGSSDRNRGLRRKKSPAISISTSNHSIATHSLLLFFFYSHTFAVTQP